MTQADHVILLMLFFVIFGTIALVAYVVGDLKKRVKKLEEKKSPYGGDT